MLSRLSGLANTVLQELSGEGEDAGDGAVPAGPELQPSQQNGEEPPEDVLERLAHMERLVVQLKDLVREKDAQLQQKDASLQEERQAADAKLAKLKLQAKAKLASLNKRIEELAEQRAAVPTEEPPPPCKSDQETCKKQEEEVEALRRKLQEQEAVTGKLQEQLGEATGSLKEARSQLSSLQGAIQEKDSLLEEQARQHRAELHQLAAQSTLEAEMQQNLRLLQRKLEEQEAALLGRTQVVELLQQELNSLEEQKQVLLEKFQTSEAELESLRRTSASERQQSQSFVEKLELELAERKQACHLLQEEVQQLSQELAQARAAEEAHGRESRDAEKRRLEELGEQSQQIAQLQGAEQDLHSRYDALLAENSRLWQDVKPPLECSANQVSSPQGELPEGCPEQGCSQAPPETLAAHTLELVSAPDKDEISLLRKESQLESEQLKTVVKKLEAENESLRAKLASLENRLEFAASAQESSQVGCADAGREVPPLLVSGVSSTFGDGSSGPGDSLDAIGSIRAESLDSPDVPTVLTQPSSGGSVEEPPVNASGHPDVLQSLSAKKRKELSVLLLELQEAQEEMTFLKGQLQDSGSPALEEDAQPRGKPPASGVEEGERGEAGLVQSDSSSSSLVTVEIQEEAPPLLGMPSEQGDMRAEGSGPPPAPAWDSVLQPQELGKAPLGTAELHSSWQEVEECHEEALGQKAAEVERLQQQLEDSRVTLCTLTAERDQLLSQLKELCSLAELKEQVRQLEGDLADSEKQRLSDYESGISQLGLLKEQIQSLKNEAKSKEVKIEALQRDLDEAQHRLAEQDLLARSLGSQLQREEEAGRALAGRLQESTAEVEQLSQSIVSKGMEVGRLEKLIAERSAQVERLQQDGVEREQQLAEVSVSMSDRMVQLNEEKFVLGKELKGLREQLSQFQQGKETRDLGVGTDGEPGQWAEGVSSASEELEALRKENEHVRKKLQAALVSRKELLSKIHKMESGGQPGELGAKAPEMKESAGAGEPSEVSTDASVEESPDSQGPAASLSQLLPAKEAELQIISREKGSAVAGLQAVVEELQQGLQEKDLLISALRAEAEDHKKQALEVSAALAHVKSCATAPGQEEQERIALEEGKTCALEQEKAQLQRKLQEMLASRKNTLKKAQEKDRHHREQLRQQKEEYGLLQEQFEEQSREKERVHKQLQLLQAQMEALESPSFPTPDAGALPEGAPRLPASVQEAGWEVPGGSEMGNFLASSSCPAAGDLAVEQLETELGKLQGEKGEMEAQLHRLRGELRSKSEEAGQLQEQSGQLLAEMEAVKMASHQAEANVMSLRAELEESRAELGRLESLRVRQLSREEEKERANKEEIRALKLQLVDKTELLHNLEAQLQERAEAAKALQGQLEVQAKEQTQRLQAEQAEMQQKSATEESSRAQLQRKLQAALISRKEVLRENKLLQEELATTKTALERESGRLSEAENQASELEKEKQALLEKLEAVTEERGKLIAEVDKALVENQSLSGSCESLKLALEGVTQEKARLGQDVDALRCSQAEALSEWQRKHQELQKEYETLLQSYENVSNEAERIQRVVEGVRQEKQELFLKLKSAEAEKREGEARLQGAEQEMEGMREKMRKFAKSKQQKILELEEENERLRAEAPPLDGGPGGAGELSAQLGEELERSKESCQALSRQVEALVAEKDSLSQEIWGLRQKLQGKVEEAGRSDVPGDAAAEKEAATSPLVAPSEAGEGLVDPNKASEAPELAAVSLKTEEEEEEGKAGGPSSDDINGYLQQVAQLTEQVAQLEEMRRVEAEKLGRALVDVEALAEERKCLEEQLAAKAQELGSLQDKALGLEQAHQRAEEQLAGMTKLKAALEAEKDDLEERLMNQLAELNGSIGNYQQDVADLRSQTRQLLAEVEALQGALSRLEEEKRHLLREKAEAEAEKKEHVEKLRSAWKGGGGRTQVKELQELLREKQQEVRQLQRDCIKSQEKVSSLERTIKALEFVQSESHKELEATKRSLAKADDGAKKAQAELGSCRVLLDDTQSEAARVLVESLKAKEELQASKEQLRAQLRLQEEELERRLEQEKGQHAKELRNVEERLEARQREQARLEGVVRGLQESLGQKDQEARQLQGSLNHALAQLAAFSRSMSSLQDDRDRVIDKSRQWERKFSEAIEKKEQELRAREKACAALEEQAKQAAAQMEALRSHVVSLENSKSAEETRSQKELQRLQEEIGLLKEANKTLTLQLEEVRQLFGDSQNQLQKQESELRSLREQLADLQGSYAQCKEAREEMESAVKRQEADLRECRLCQEQLEADLRASKELTDKLHGEIGSQEQRVVSLLAAREEAVAAAVSESQRRHEEERREMESRLGQGEAERAALEGERRKALERADRLLEKLKGAREESRKHQAQLGSFTQAMSSLQDDRDRLLGDYQQLEQRHLSGLLEKDQLIQEAAAENNTLKEELRGLHGRMDDLHAENAKLDAELMRYREDLNQLISIKDSQQKQLLGAQLERLQALEKEKAGLEGLLRESEHALAGLRRDKQHLEQERKALLASLSQVRGEVAALQEGGPLLELQAQLQARVDEAQELSSQLSLAQRQVAELEEELALVREDTARQMQEAETQMKKELKSLHHDAGLMRNETETAEERVAELAKDLLETEQNLLALTEENQDLKAQIQSFGKAMSSLQDSWDQSNEELRVLEEKYSADVEERQSLVQSLQEEKAELQVEQRALAQERSRLASELAALRHSVEENGLLARLEKLSQQLQARDAELRHLTSELERASGQVKSFARAMASLQDERDRLLSELDKARRVGEVLLQSTPDTSTNLTEAQSLKRALSSLQNDRERLLAELKSLQQQHLQAGVDTAEFAQLKAQWQEQKREAERQQRLQEQLKQELRQLREEKAAWGLETKDQPLSRVQTAVRESRPSVPLVEEQHQRQVPPEAALQLEASGPEAEKKHLQAQLGSSLKELHQKELRIQQLNSKLSQVFEEKNALSLQLRGSSRSLRESQQRYGDVLARCEALEKQLPPPLGKDVGSLPTDAAPGAPQERNEHPRESHTPELQELQRRLTEARRQESSAKQGLLQLEELLQGERGRRRAAEEACSAARDHIRRLESSQWEQSLETSVDMPPTSEHALLVGSAEGSFSKARQSTAPRRLLRSLFCSRTRLPLLATAYLLTVHVLLLLCFTGLL
ncbi:golgin subfamily B member 1 isoform X2 [Eublepharis macularius]|uniref:Golgin subfamily B member 1 isoform X2 n=1 Tax=Eublepharis macularius TaxID=481883 RepID=A0AA97JXQ1_EUBMA|nr:golgin subfamily B member 1 isoform X2 [Eublepharis macularius]